MFLDFKPLETTLSTITPTKRFGHVLSVGSSAIHIRGLLRHGRVGDQVIISKTNGTTVKGEIIALEQSFAVAMSYEPHEGIAIGNRVELHGEQGIFPSPHWVGRVIDAFGNPLDEKPLYRGSEVASLRKLPPMAASRRPLGPRLNTSLAVFNTILPIARGQRIGVFAGSGVGKTSLLAELARGIEPDIVVIALIGERGHELNDFVKNVLGKEGMQRAIVIAATSDQSPLIKRRAAWAATAVAEFFRDRGKHVLLLMDSITRFAEAHREIALTAGEAPSLRAYPPSTANLIAGLTERSGPGPKGGGDITAVFSVLVAGSDMEEPIADITRGVLDGHIILDREIAERGRFPAIDINQSVSRSLPNIASKHENKIIQAVKKCTSTFEQAAPMIQTGLYIEGSDTAIDNAIQSREKLEGFFSRNIVETAEQSFSHLLEFTET